MRDGYLSRKDVIDVMVMFNDATAAKDIYRVRDGGVILYDDSNSLPANLKRDGVQYFGFPANKLVAKFVPASPLRAKQRNMVYVGALAYLFGIDMSVIKAVLEDTFGKKPAVIESNMICIDAGYQYCKEQGYKQNIARLEPIPNGNKGKIITEGNTAAALGAIYGGASVDLLVSDHAVEFSGGSDGILPAPVAQTDRRQKGLCHCSGGRRNRFRRDDRRRRMGGRARHDLDFRAGLSLMNESIGLAYYAEIPCVSFHYSAWRPIHRFADPDPASGHLAHVRRIPWRYPPYYSDSP